MADPAHSCLLSNQRLNDANMLLFIRPTAHQSIKNVGDLVVPDPFGEFFSVGFVPIWTILSIKTSIFGLFKPFYFEPSSWTCMFGPVYMVRSIGTCLFGPVHLAQYIWTLLPHKIYFSPLIGGVRGIGGTSDHSAY